MSDSIGNNDELHPECWSNPWEKQLEDELETTEETHRQTLEASRNETQQKLWDIFQNTAQCVAILYKGTCEHPAALWGPFQTAAGNVTSLYKESLEGLRRNIDIAVELGYHRRNKEVANFIRKKRNCRRDDILSYLSGRPLPTKPSHLRGSPRTRLSAERVSSYNNQQSHPVEEDLSAFCDALHGTNNAFTPRRRNSSHPQDLQTFMNTEYSRQKRSAPSPPRDVTMDSPQHKRFKFS